MGRRAPDSIGISIAAGAVAGLVAAFAMNQSQAALRALAGSKPENANTEQADDATVKAAQAVSEKALGHTLTPDEKKWAGPAMHYAMGTTLGAAYGALAPLTPIELGFGTLYGTAVWIGADEVAVPSLGLSERPDKTPIDDHAKALAAHLVFGLVTHFARRLLLKFTR